MDTDNIKVLVNEKLDNIIPDFTNNGECSKCGHCCGRFLPLSPDEINKIKKYIKYRSIKENVHFTPLSKQSLDYTCPFRNNNKKICTIYEVRPEICKVFICNSKKRIKENTDELLNGKRKIIDMQKMFFK